MEVFSAVANDDRCDDRLCTEIHQERQPCIDANIPPLYSHLIVCVLLQACQKIDWLDMIAYLSTGNQSIVSPWVAQVFISVTALLVIHTNY